MVFLFILSILSLDSILNQPELFPAQVGIYVLNLDNDSVIYAYNSQKLLIPASNMKIVTSGAALYFLGQGYRFKTRLALKGTVSGDKLLGDIVIIGGGDPQFSLRNLRRFVYTIKNIGVKEISGDIIVVDEYFTDERLPMGWSRHYFDAHYAPEISALSVNRNCINVKIEATELGDYARVTIEPETKYVKLFSNMVTKPGDDSVIIYRLPESNIIYVDGGIGTGHKRNIEVALKDPTMFAGNYFKERLYEADIKFNGRVIKGNDKTFFVTDTSNVYNVIDSVISAPLIDIVKETNIESVNLNAEILLKTLGAYYYNEGSFLAGLSKVKKFLQRCGIDTSVLSLWDGSGLSRHNLISPYYLALVLRYMYLSKNFKDFYALFPAPDEGTLKDRFEDFNYSMRAKTGTLHAVSCLSGYLQINETNYCFSMMFNNFTCRRKRIGEIQEEILNVLGDYLTERTKKGK